MSLANLLTLHLIRYSKIISVRLKKKVSEITLWLFMNYLTRQWTLVILKLANPAFSESTSIYSYQPLILTTSCYQMICKSQYAQLSILSTPTCLYWVLILQLLSLLFHHTEWSLKRVTDWKLRPVLPWHSPMRCRGVRKASNIARMRCATHYCELSPLPLSLPVSLPAEYSQLLMNKHHYFALFLACWWMVRFSWMWWRN